MEILYIVYCTSILLYGQLLYIKCDLVKEVDFLEYEYSTSIIEDLNCWLVLLT